MSNGGVLIGLVGDVLVHRENPAEAFSEVRGVMDAPDILFGNLESAYTDEPRWVPGAAGGATPPARYLGVFPEVGFDVLAMANNHILDVGYEAMRETRSRLRARGVKTCGVGDNLVDAREPAIVGAGGIRVAFLAYASVFPMGYEARSNTPGLAPMRAYNFWRDPYPTVHVPGKQPLVTTVPDEGDLARLAEDIAGAREKADVVVASFHWGEYQRPHFLTDHEIRTARYCIDQGAHMVVGHHHHALRGMEWYKGRPIMYGLGHFVFDLRMEWTERTKKDLADLLSTAFFDQTAYTTAPREGWPLLPMHEDTRMTVMAWAQAGRDGVSDIGFLPCRLTPDGRVHALDPDSTEGAEVVAYMERCNSTQSLKGRIVADDAPEIAGFRTLRVVPG